jgi:threonyl-tRNA synthetase
LVGERERAGNCVAVRSRKEGELGEVSVDAVVEKLSEEVRMRMIQTIFPSKMC